MKSNRVDEALWSPSLSWIHRPLLKACLLCLSLVLVTSGAFADEENWQYTTEKPAAGWEAPGFDDSGWKTGPGGFGRPTRAARVQTRWDSLDVWLRRAFEIEQLPKKPALLIFHDENAEVYLNGVLLGRLEGFTKDYAALAALAVSSHADPSEIDIDCSAKVVRGSEPLRYGICMNYLIDSDTYDSTRKHKIRESLKALNVKAIRWNEGEIGDKMIWAIPPFKVPDAHVTHQRTPGTVHYNWRVDENGKMRPAMEIDEAIAIAKDLKLELFIIVGIDAIWVEDPSVRALDTSGKGDELGTLHKQMTDYRWAAKGKSAREMIVAGTRALARYLAEEAAEVDVFLEIGNENYLGDANWKPERYAELVNVLSREIKDTNSKIHVGAQLAHQYRWTSVSGDGRGWNEVLREMLDVNKLDHFVVHQYGYKDTLNLDSAITFLGSLSTKNQRRIDITVTETGTWHLPQSKERWSPNDLHRSLYQFRWLGFLQLKGGGKVRTPLFWASRWLDVLKQGAYEKSFNALNLNGELTPSGQAIRIWNNFVHDSLVKVTISPSPEDMQCYASLNSADPNQLTVWLVNNHPDERTVSLQLHNYGGSRISGMYRYAGDGPTDNFPDIRQVCSPPVLRQTAPPSIDCTMQPYSITVFQFDGKDQDSDDPQAATAAEKRDGRERSY